MDKERLFKTLNLIGEMKETLFQDWKMSDKEGADIEWLISLIIEIDQDPKAKLKLAYELLKEIEDDPAFRNLEQAELGEIAYRLGFKFDLGEE